MAHPISKEPIKAAQYQNIPVEMRNAKRWLLWSFKANPDSTKKPRKVPYYASGDTRQGTLDSPADLAQLVSFDDAMVALSSRRYTGLGFALGPDGSGAHWQGK